jgi:hypothetical protein
MHRSKSYFSSYFAAYRRAPKIADVQRWLSYFSAKDQGMARKVLDHVELISEDDIQKGYKDGLSQIPGWHANHKKRQGRWFFCGFGKPDESGQAMVRIFCEATGIKDSESKKLFIVHPTELATAELDLREGMKAAGTSSTAERFSLVGQNTGNPLFKLVA